MSDVIVRVPRPVARWLAERKLTRLVELDRRIEELLAVRLRQGGLTPADVALIRAALEGGTS